MCTDNPFQKWLLIAILGALAACQGSSAGGGSAGTGGAASHGGPAGTVAGSAGAAAGGNDAGRGGAGGSTGSVPGSCSGIPQACAMRADQTACVTVGCKWKSDMCVGTPLACGMAANNAGCAAIAGCWFDGTTSACSGSAYGCGLMLASKECATQGCNWAPANCSGTPDSCDQFPNEFSCLSAGCAWGTGGTGGPLTTGGTSASGGVTGNGGIPGSGGRTGFGGTPGSGDARGGSAGSRPNGSGGATSGAGTGGTRPDAGGQDGDTRDAAGITIDAAPAAPCTVGIWPAADPATIGPFATVTQAEVGPKTAAGIRFTLWRPKDLVQGGLCHPVIVFGDGTGALRLYQVILNHLASHGFVVIAYNSGNLRTVTPRPMLVGLTWVLQQNDDPTSVMYQRIDTTHVGATGHGEGGVASSELGTDSHILTTAPIAGALAESTLHGPAILFCGGRDFNVVCTTTIQAVYDGTSNVPTMLANNLAVDHSNWITLSGSDLSATEVALTAWMRVQLMRDTALRSWFYGPSCKLCTDTTVWKVQRKLMDPLEPDGGTPDEGTPD
jgi:hypothetical protein